MIIINPLINWIQLLFQGRLYKVEREEFHRDPDKLLNRLHRTYMRREVKRRGYDRYKHNPSTAAILNL